MLTFKYNAIMTGRTISTAGLIVYNIDLSDNYIITGSLKLGMEIYQT